MGVGADGWVAAMVLVKIRARGDVPFLHVATSNPAVTLYERLSFTVTRNLRFTGPGVPG